MKDVRSRYIKIEVIENRPNIEVVGSFTVAEVLELSEFLKRFILGQRIVYDRSDIEKASNDLKLDK